MREGTWFVKDWRKKCTRCEQKIEGDDDAYCYNCGKWLGVIRRHVWSFFSCAAFLILVSVSSMAVSLFMPTQTAFGMRVPGMVIGFVGLLFLVAIKPMGMWIHWVEQKRLKAKAHNAECARLERERMAQEDQEERERSANAKADSGIDIQIHAINGSAVQEMLIKSRDQIQAMVEEVQTNPEAERIELFRLILDKVNELRDRTEELIEKANALEEEPPQLSDCNCGEGERSRFHMNWCEMAKKKEPQPITFTTVSKGIDKFTDIACSCGRTNRVIHMRDEFICPCGARYVRTSKGWRPEERCCLQFGSEMCVGTYGDSFGEESCNKTARDCQRHGNFERFAPMAWPVE